MPSKNDEISNGSVLNDNVEEIDEEKTNTVRDEWQDILGSGSIMKKIITEGEPDTKPQRLQKCTIKYSCSLEDETVVDQSESFEFELGDCDVVQGLDVAVALMNVNERCLLKIEPRLGFGKKGLPPKIPGNSVVLYDVELLKVEPEEDTDSLTILERKKLGNKKRERGNWWYLRGENTLAIQCYRRALDYLDEVEGGISEPTPDGKEEVTDADLQSLLEDRISVCNNMAAAQIKMELYDAALTSLQTVLRCQPNNVKALFRKAKVLTGKNDPTAALKCLQKANKLSPNDVDIQKQMNQVTQLLQKQKVTERELARRMFNGLTNDNTKPENKTLMRSKLHIWATLGVSIVVGVAGVVAYKFKYA